MGGLRVERDEDGIRLVNYDVPDPKQRGTLARTLPFNLPLAVDDLASLMNEGARWRSRSRF